MWLYLKTINYTWTLRGLSIFPRFFLIYLPLLKAADLFEKIALNVFACFYLSFLWSPMIPIICVFYSIKLSHVPSSKSSLFIILQTSDNPNTYSFTLYCNVLCLSLIWVTWKSDIIVIILAVFYCGVNSSTRSSKQDFQKYLSNNYLVPIERATL